MEIHYEEKPRKMARLEEHTDRNHDQDIIYQRNSS